MTNGTVQFILVAAFLLFWVWVLHATDKPFEEMMREPKRKSERTEEDGKRKVADMMPQTEILARLSEELSESAQAALKAAQTTVELRRALEGTDQTPKAPEERWEQLDEAQEEVEAKVPRVEKPP